MLPHGLWPRVWPRPSHRIQYFGCQGKPCPEWLEGGLLPREGRTEVGQDDSERLSPGPSPFPPGERTALEPQVPWWLVTAPPQGAHSPALSSFATGPLGRHLPTPTLPAPTPASRFFFEPKGECMASSRWWIWQGMSEALTLPVLTGRPAWRVQKSTRVSWL